MKLRTVARFDYEFAMEGTTKYVWRHMLDQDEDGYVVSWWVKRLSSYVMLCELSPTGLDQAVRVFLDHYKSNSLKTTPANNALTILIKDDAVLEAVKRLAPVVLGERACQSFDSTL